MKQIEWTSASLEDMGALDKGIARRVKQAVERFAETGVGSVKSSRASIHLSIAYA